MEKKKRRRKNRKKQIRRNLFIFVFAVLVTLAILCLTVFFKIDTVTAEGSLVYGNEEIIDQCVSLYGKNIILTGNKTVLNTLQNKLPFVESVKLKKSLDGKLHIKVTDATEVYCFENNETYFTASKNMRVLNSYNANPGGVICVKADLNEIPDIGKTVSFSDITQKNNLETVATLLTNEGITVNEADVKNSANLTFTVNDRLKVNFGTLNYINEKISHLKGMISSIDESREGSINLSAYSPENKQGFFTETHKN